MGHIRSGIRGGWFGLLVMFLLGAAIPAAAVEIPVQFLQLGSPTGMNPSGFPTPVDFTVTAASDIRPVSGGVVTDGFGVDLNVCAIINEIPGAGCQSTQPPGSSGFSLYVDMTLLSEPDGLTDPSIIFFTTLPSIPTYTVSQVSLIVDATPEPGFFDPTPFTTARYAAGPGIDYYYLGFQLGVGDTARFRVDVDGDHSGAGQTLIFGASGLVVPEPSTALLLAAGLLVLSRHRSR